jgi:hypothetical protein
MDAYDLYQEIFKAWQALAHKPSPESIKKQWTYTPVYIDGKEVTGVIIEDNKITLTTK